MFSLIGEHVANLAIVLSPYCVAKLKEYDANLDNELESAKRPIHIGKLQSAHNKRAAFTEFTRSIGLYLINGWDPDHPLEATPKPHVYVLKIAPWFCYFYIQTVGNQGQGSGTVLFHKADKPKKLAELQESVAKQWLAKIKKSDG